MDDPAPSCVIARALIIRSKNKSSASYLHSLRVLDCVPFFRSCDGMTPSLLVTDHPTFRSSSELPALVTDLTPFRSGVLAFPTNIIASAPLSFSIFSTNFWLSILVLGSRRGVTSDSTGDLLTCGKLATTAFEGLSDFLVHPFRQLISIMVQNIRCCL